MEDEERCLAITCSTIVREGEAAIDIGQIATCRELDRLDRKTSSSALEQPGTQPDCEAQRNSGIQGRPRMLDLVSFIACDRSQQTISPSYHRAMGRRK